MSSQEPPHRAPGVTERMHLNREAMVVARPFNDIIDSWTLPMSRLLVRANRSGKTDEIRSDLTEEIKGFQRAIEDLQIALLEATKALPSAIASNDRLTATRLHLRNAGAAADTIRAALTVPAKGIW